MALTKLSNEFTALEALLATAAIWPGVGLDESPFTALSSASTDDLRALLSLGKSLLAELTSVVASLSIVVSFDFTALISLMLKFVLVRFLTDFSRLARFVQ